MTPQETIKKRAEEYGTSDRGYDPEIQDAYEAGATSLLPALEILARFVENYEGTIAADKAIAAVKARGDWPLGGAGSSSGQGVK